MRTLVVAAVAVLGCKGKHEDIPAPPSSAGSALVTMTGPATAQPAQRKPPLERYAECIGFSNAARWDDYKACYTPLAKFEQPGLGDPHGLGEELGERKSARIAFPDEQQEPQLVMTSGNTVIAIVRVSATNSKPLTGPTSTIEPTNKRAGLLLGQIVTFDATGRANHDAAYFDVATIVSQMGKSKLPARTPEIKPWEPKVTIAATGAASEQANVKVVEAYAAAFTKHDGKAIAALLADTVVWSEQPIDKDFDRAAAVAQAESMWRAFSNLKLTITASWAAGEYVAATATLAGTNDGELVAYGLPKTGKPLELPVLGVYRVTGGKIAAAWLFWQRQAIVTQLR